MKNKNNIVLVSTARSDLSLWMPIFDQLNRDERFKCKIIITGTHFLDECGNTYLEAKKLFKQEQCVFLDPNEQAPFKWFSHTADLFYDYLVHNKTDLVFFLGDRIELMPLISAAMYLIKPIAHIYAGEEDLTYSHDTQVRNALTKVAHILMVTHDDVKQRLLQMGEEEWRIEVVGNCASLDVDFNDKQILQFLQQHDSLINKKKLVNCCYHSTTSTPGVWKYEIPALFEALDYYNEYEYIWTGVNADNEHIEIKGMLNSYIKDRDNHLFFDHLGGELYRSLLINSHFMIGNSSSGLLEAPIYKVPSINIGNRNAGRLHGTSVVDCAGSAQEIMTAIAKAIATPKDSICNVFGNNHFPQNISEHISKCLSVKDLIIKRMRPIDYTLKRVPEYI